MAVWVFAYSPSLYIHAESVLIVFDCPRAFKWGLLNPLSKLLKDALTSEGQLSNLPSPAVLNERSASVSVRLCDFVPFHRSLEAGVSAQTVDFTPQVYVSQSLSKAAIC